MSLVTMDRGQYRDVWADTQIKMLSRGAITDSEELMYAVAWLKDYIQTLQTGRIQARDHAQVERRIRQVDDTLRLRWDFEQGMYAIDRYCPDLGCMLTLFYWSHTLGEGGAIANILRESDMQAWSSPQDYHNHKRTLQQHALELQDKKRTEIALAAVDSLTTARIRNFIAVERAMQIGEKVDVRGEDAKFLQKQYDRTRTGQIPTLPGEQMCINPHMNPFKHKRNIHRNQA